MSVALAVLAVAATTPVVRGRMALGVDPPEPARWAAVAGLVALGLATVVCLPPLAAAADVSAPTVRIAAGLIVAVTTVPDLFRRPVVAGPTDPPWRAGVVPVAFPELFGPPLAAALTTATVDLGLAAGTGLAGLAAGLALVADRLPGPRSPSRPARALAGLRAAAAVAAGLALTADGVFDL